MVRWGQDSIQLLSAESDSSDSASACASPKPSTAARRPRFYRARSVTTTSTSHQFLVKEHVGTILSLACIVILLVWIILLTVVSTKLYEKVFEVQELTNRNENCKKRWGNIRDQFKKTLNKRKTKSGQITKVVKKYKYEDTLQFLLPHIQDRDTVSNIEDDNESANVSNQADYEMGVSGTVQLPAPDVQPVDESMELPPSTPTLLSQPPDDFPPVSSRQRNSLSVSRTIRKRLHRNLRTMTQAPPRKSSESPSNTPMKYITEKNKKSQSDVHPIDAFFQGLIPTVKRFSPYYQHLAKGRVFSVVQDLEYEQLHLPGPTSELYTSPPYESSASSTSTGVQQAAWTSPVCEAPPYQTPAAPPATTSNVTGTSLPQSPEESD